MEIEIRNKEQQAIDNLKAIINCKDKIIEIEPSLEDTAQILLDYITNLQEENKRLKERCEYLQRSCERKEEQMLDYRMEYMEQEDYKSKIDKAIEHIKSHQIIYTSQYGESAFDNHLLEILRGEDK